MYQSGVLNRILPTLVLASLMMACIEDSASQVDPVQDLDGAQMAPATEADGTVTQPDAGLVSPDMMPLAPTPMAACGNEDDLAPNQDPESAHVVETGFTRADLFICPDTDDWFRIQLREGQQIKIVIEADPVETDLDLAVLSDVGAVVGESAQEEGREALEFVSPAAGEYFIRVDGYLEQAAFYSLSISGACQLDNQCPDGHVCDRFTGQCSALLAGDCGGDAHEPNNVDDSASPLGMAPAEVEGTLCGTDRDWFSFDAQAGDSFEMLISFPEGEDIDVHVINGTTGAVIDQATGDRRSNPERLSFSHLPEGQYRIGLTLFVGDAPADRNVNYAIEFVGRSGACEADRDCTADGLPLCADGVCVAVTPGASPGERCARDADCDDRSDQCYTGFTGGHDNVCTVQCRQDGDCDALGQSAYCQPIQRNSAVCLPGCQSNDDCGIFYQCNEQRCEIRGACRINTDCDEGEVCRASRTGDRYCSLPTDDAVCGADVGNDPNNQRDNATEIGPDETIAGLQTCNADDDWYGVDVPAEKAGWLMQVGVRFREGVDIDVYVYDEFGNLVGSGTSPDQVDEVADIRFINGGRYFIRVDQFASDRLVDTEYELRTAIIDNEESCTADGGECNRTEPLRAQCDVETGGCRAIEGNGQIQLGAACDSADDCTDEAEFCWSFEGGGEFNICTVRCGADDDCAHIEDTVCTVFRGRFGACLPPRNNGN